MNHRVMLMSTTIDLSSETKYSKRRWNNIFNVVEVKEELGKLIFYP